jgi:dethiobiotin synthase
MPRRFFITGTDTGIGKTVVSALLCAALDAIYWKPIQTGAGSGNETDRQTVMRLAKITEDKTILENYCFDDPVSPHLAARWSGTEIELFSMQRPLLPNAQALVIEGAGGVLVPINDREFITDLIKHLGYPAVLVSRSTLGTINHTLLAVQALKHAGISVMGVVMVGVENSDNRRAIQQFGQASVIGSVPELSRMDRDSLMDVYQNHFDQSAFSE